MILCSSDRLGHLGKQIMFVKVHGARHLGERSGSGTVGGVNCSGSRLVSRVNLFGAGSA